MALIPEEQLSRVIVCSPKDIRTKAFPAIPCDSPSLRIVDLFAGCGGLSLGAVQAACKLGMKPEIRLAIDNNAVALAVYRENLSQLSAQIRNASIEDVFDVGSQEYSQLSEGELSIRETAGTVDVLLAGPPCQGHSDLNNASRRSDPRNELYMAPVRAVAVLNPALVIIENVPTVVHSDEKVVSRATDALTQLGYYVVQAIVDFTALGVPQSRRRHLLIGTRSSAASSQLKTALANLKPQNVPLLPYIEDLIDEPDSIPASAYTSTTKVSQENQARINFLFSNQLYDLPNAQRPKCHKDGNHSYMSMYGRMYPDRPAQTITSGFGSMGQGRYVHPVRPRMISAHEAARIQAFPDFFSFSAGGNITSLRQMVANAVPPPVSQYVVQVAGTLGLFEKSSRE